ncbi:MAG: hypothetical protein EA369_10010 [Bradymonadales bacterium]|nr:MAG: hypothetical protein EA369_10010 [Bradymonadales bacterium]
MFFSILALSSVFFTASPGAPTPTRACRSAEVGGVYQFSLGTWQMEEVDRSQAMNHKFLRSMLEPQHIILFGQNKLFGFGLPVAGGAAVQDYGSYSIDHSGLLTARSGLETASVQLICVDSDWNVNGQLFARPGDIILQFRLSPEESSFNIYSQTSLALPVEYQEAVSSANSEVEREPAPTESVEKAPQARTVISRQPTHLVFSESPDWKESKEIRQPTFYSREWNDSKRLAIVSVSKTVFSTAIDSDRYATVFVDQMRPKGCESKIVESSVDSIFKSDPTKRARYLVTYACQNVDRYGIGVLLAGNSFEIYSNLIEFTCPEDLEKNRAWAEGLLRTQVGVCLESSAEDCRRELSPLVASP